MSQPANLHRAGDWSAVMRVRALSNRTRYCSVEIGSALNWHAAFGSRLGLQRTVSWYRHSGLLGGES